MPQTFSDDKKIYSVDMMFAYINIFKPKYTKIKIDQLLHNLEYKGWGDPKNNLFYSPKQVLENPRKYKDEIKRINEANLKYPIIVYNNNIVDGVHRLSKSYLLNKKTIKAYIFDDKTIKNFIIDKNKDWNKVDKIQVYNYIELFIKKFNLVET
jgi:hypothetical protein